MLYDAIVIGAGQAGLAAGFHLQQARLNFLILEATDTPGGAWPRYYDSLVLNSPARYSSLPGLPFPGHPDRYPSRDEVVAYLHAYAAHFQFPIVSGSRVVQVERSGQGFRLITEDNRYYMTHSLVAATGFFGQPNMPNLPGQGQYRGRLLHVAAYRSPAPFRGQRVVIVGGGNGAVQLGVELASVARVTLATRKPIRFLPQRLLGRDIHFWLHHTGLDHRQWQANASAPVYATERYRAALASGRLEQKPIFTRFTEDGVAWSDGHREAVDTVLFATGYRPDLAYLKERGALDDTGSAMQQQGRSTTVPGLYYVGLPKQRSAASATLRGAAVDARIVVDHLRRYCVGLQCHHQSDVSLEALRMSAS